MRLRLLAAAVASLAVTACGSTVQVRGTASVGDPSLGGAPGLAESGSTSGGSTGFAGTTGGSGSGSTSGSTSGTSGSTGGSTSGTGATQAPVAGTTGVVGTGGKKKPVELGIVIFPDVGAAASALGASADVGDQKAEAQLAVAWVNAHGGLAGHKIVPVFYEVELTSSDSYAQTYQKICSTFTQDHHVVASIFIGNAEKALPQCLTKKGGLFLGHGHYIRTAAEFASLPLLMSTQEVNSDRIATALVDEIVAQGFLKKGETLGLLTMDYEGPRKARDTIIVPQLKARGINVLKYEIAYAQSTPAIAGSASAVQSAELAMSARGVKNVTFLCPGCMTFFMQYAESQGYYPRYIATSLDGLYKMADAGHDRSLASTYALGWEPIKDVTAYPNAGYLAKNPTFNLCRQIEKSEISGNDSLFAAQALCGALQDLYAAANANPTAEITGASLRDGFGRLGTSYQAAANLSTILTPQRRDGAGSYRVARFTASCTCFTYDGGNAKPFG
jgi:hypothetical protein